jgi:Uma2 family endonuclease
MAEPAPALGMTVAEFVRWDDGSAIRYELAFGAPVAMAPPTGRHVVIVRNVARALDRQVKAPCGAYTGGGVARADDDDEFRLPDLFVSCEPTPPVYYCEPRLVVEVLSPSTEKVDRTDKLDFYRSLPSVEAVVLVWQDARRVQIVERREGLWTMQDKIGGGELAVAAVGIGLTLDEIYEGVELPVEEP